LPVLQVEEPPTTRDGQHVSPAAQHTVPQRTEQPASPPSLPPLLLAVMPLLLALLPVLPLLLALLPVLPPLLALLPLLLALLPASECGEPSGPESAPPPPSMREPLLPLPSTPLLLGAPLDEALEVPLDEPLDVLPDVPLLPPLVLAAPLPLAPLPPGPPLLLAALPEASAPSDALNAPPPHSGIAIAMASAPNARARFLRTTNVSNAQ